MGKRASRKHGGRRAGAGARRRKKGAIRAGGRGARIPERVESKAQVLGRRPHVQREARLRAALAAWVDLEWDEQRIIAEALVETRGGELRRAYPGLCGIGFGRRAMRHERVVTDELVISFMVERKVGRPPPAQQLPEFLLTYWGGGRGRPGTLYAIPTDVHAREAYGVRPSAAPRYVRVQHAHVEDVEGVLTCLVRAPGIAETLVLSCHHVLAMSRKTVPRGARAEGAQVHSVGDAQVGPILARLSSYCGHFARGERSLDAALAMVGDLTAVRAVLGPPPAYWWDGAMPKYGTIRTPDGDCVMEWVDTYAQLEIQYFETGPQPIIRADAWRMAGSGRPRDGHSGSRLLGVHGELATLQGMYIAGSSVDVPAEQARFFTLPVSELFRLTNYETAAGVALEGELELVV